MDVGSRMYVSELWRYPVKTMAGEALERTVLGPLGVAGDRIVHVEDAKGRVITSRTHPRLLGHRAAIDAEGHVLVDGRAWESDAAAADVRAIVGKGARLVRHEGSERFDVLPLLVATDGAIAAFGHDHRRLRPNIVIGGVPGLAEREWEGKTLRIGETLVGVRDLRLRCIMTSFDPDTQVQDARVTRGIYERFEGKLALNAFVVEGGEVAVGDPVLLGPPA